MVRIIVVNVLCPINIHNFIFISVYLSFVCNCVCVILRRQRKLGH